jgi:hypothetical protein
MHTGDSRRGSGDPAGTHSFLCKPPSAGHPLQHATIVLTHLLQVGHKYGAVEGCQSSQVAGDERACALQGSWCGCCVLLRSRAWTGRCFKVMMCMRRVWACFVCVGLFCMCVGLFCMCGPALYVCGPALCNWQGKTAWPNGMRGTAVPSWGLVYGARLPAEVVVAESWLHCSTSYVLTATTWASWQARQCTCTLPGRF